MLEWLQSSPLWQEVVERHGLTDVTAVRRRLQETASVTNVPAHADVLLQAAVLWRFDPAALPEGAVDVLRPRVADSSLDRWTLRGNERDEADARQRGPSTSSAPLAASRPPGPASG